MQNNFKYPSVEAQIKKTFGNRIFICLLLTLSLILLIGAITFQKNMTDLNKDLNSKCLSLEDFIISQVLVPNQSAIQLKIVEFNQENKLIQLSWINDSSAIPSPGLHWQPVFSWVYIYPLRMIVDEKFGYFRITGSMLSDKELYFQLLPTFLILLLFSVFLFLLLYPLTKSIPKNLFIDPINELLNMLSHKKKAAPKPIFSLTQEIYEIQIRFQTLIEYTKDISKKNALINLATQVAHDIGSPLAAIEVAITNLKKANVCKNNIKLLEDSIKNVREISSNLLTRYRQGQLLSEQDITLHDKSSQARYILLHYLIQDTIKTKELEWATNQCNINYTFDKLVYLIWLFISPMEMKRKLSNLLNNAYESLPQNERRTIEIRLQTTAEIILTIQDSGLGIPEDKINAVLAGNSLKHPGKGLGLISAQEYFTTLKGKLTLESKVNEGTTVTITIPKQLPPAWLPSNITYSSSSTFIILDDDPSIHMTWQIRLGDIGIKSKHFSKCKELLEWLATSADNSYIFIIDYEIYGDRYTGLDVIDNLKVTNAIYLTTSHAENPCIQNKVESLGIRLISKHVLPYIPLKLAHHD